MQDSGPAEAAPRSSLGSRGARLALLIGDRRRLVVALVGCSIVSGFAEAGILAVVAEIATSLVGTHAKNAHASLFNFHAGVGTLLVVAFALTGVRLLLQIPLSVLPSRISADVLAHVRADLFDAFTRASWTVQSADREGQLQETLTGQALQAAAGATQATQLITASLQFAVLLASAIYLNALAALVVGVTSAALFALLRPMRSRGVRISRELSRAQVRYAGGIAESNRLAEEAHVLGVLAAQRRRVRELIDYSQGFFFRAQLITRLITNMYQSLIYVLLVAGLGGLYLLGGHHAGALGGVVLLLLRAGTAGQLLQGAYQGVAQSMPFIERTQETQRRYAESSPVDGSEPLSAVRVMAFEHVSFAYNAERAVLADISFETQDGEAIGIVGPSGAGKSTLVQILLGLRPPTAGRYLVNGVDADRYLRADWHRRISYVPQEPRLQHASVADNIRFFRDISDEDVERAARLARIHDDIASWSQGYQTIVGPRADAVSGGQQQRICLARALAARPGVLILDEPTSSLDPQSETLIGQSLHELKDDLTLFIVAHRMSTLEMCDRVMVVVDGRLVGFDTRERLQRENAYYRHASELAVGSSAG
ncbi:MAG TPA: ABC transporter ATP-binding protein [Solirubrobacteraceae bacterium]|jgi:ABC-type multidrug transport system fused ATPase/permease subunit|nr:ABC transporter ATP-binding protein [Solirubrobacteraceae bacterium]